MRMMMLIVYFLTWLQPKEGVASAEIEDEIMRVEEAIKRVIYRHIECLVFQIIPSPHDPALGAPKGVKVTHIEMGIEAQSVSKKSQYENRVEAIKQLKVLLAHHRNK